MNGSSHGFCGKESIGVSQEDIIDHDTEGSRTREACDDTQRMTRDLTCSLQGHAKLL